MTTIASATDDKITVVTSDKGQKGDSGTDGIDGVGFNNVRYALINSPILSAFKKNKLTEVGAQFISWVRESEGNGFNRYGEFATALNDIPRQEAYGWLIETERQNLLLNSETLSTQDITVTAQTYTLSFYGTGSVTLSGVAVATLAGTGASGRVSLSFTPSAGALTLTVSGTVTRAQVEAGDFATSYIKTTASAETRSADIVTIPAGGNVPNMAQQFSIQIVFKAYALEDSVTLLSLPDGLDLTLNGAGVITLTYGAISCTGSVSQNLEYNTIVVYDGATLYLYINNVLAQSAPATAITTTNPDGQINVCDNFSGWIDGLTFYDFALNDSERELMGD